MSIRYWIYCLIAASVAALAFYATNAKNQARLAEQQAQSLTDKVKELEATNNAQAASLAAISLAKENSKKAVDGLNQKVAVYNGRANDAINTITRATKDANDDKNSTDCSKASTVSIKVFEAILDSDIKGDKK